MTRCTGGTQKNTTQQHNVCPDQGWAEAHAHTPVGMEVWEAAAAMAKTKGRKGGREPPKTSGRSISQAPHAAVIAPSQTMQSKQFI